MVFSLAPKSIIIFLPKTKKIEVNIKAVKISIVVQLPKIFSAFSLSPLPILIDARGAPPILTRAAKAEIHTITGIATPTPVKADGPIFFICPMYILSIIL